MLSWGNYMYKVILSLTAPPPGPARRGPHTGTGTVALSDSVWSSAEERGGREGGELDACVTMLFYIDGLCIPRVSQDLLIGNCCSKTGRSITGCVNRPIGLDVRSDIISITVVAYENDFRWDYPYIVLSLGKSFEARVLKHE